MALKRGVIVIEDNKPDAIELMKEKTADISNMEVVVAKTKYPQGAEKMLIKRVTGRKVPSGGLPADCGLRCGQYQYHQSHRRRYSEGNGL